MSDAAQVDEVRAANRRYYEAFEQRDLDAMSDVWHHADDVVCTHPGWKTLHGWGAVAGSWFALFGGPQQLQFIPDAPLDERTRTRSSFWRSSRSSGRTFTRTSYRPPPSSQAVASTPAR